MQQFFNSSSTNGNGRRFDTQQSLDAYIFSICNILRRSNCAGALQYVPELTWILFLRILDDREASEAEEAEALGLSFSPSLAEPFRWGDWAAPGSTLRCDTKANLFDFVHTKLLPHLKSLKNVPGA